MRKLFAALTLLALLLPAVAPARIGQWEYIGQIYQRPLKPLTTLGPIPPDSQYCINDTITNCGSLNIPNNTAGLAFCAESTGVIATAKFEEIFLRFKVMPVGGDTTNTVRIAYLVKDILADTSTAASDSMASVTVRVTPATGATDTVAALQGTATLIQSGGDPSGLVPGERLITIDPWWGRAGKVATYSGVVSRTITLFTRSDARLPVPPLIQVRVRVIGFNNADATKKPKVQCWLIGEN